MRGFFLLLMLLSGEVCAEGPRFKHKESIAQQEFENVYQDIRSGNAKYLSKSSATANLVPYTGANKTVSVSTLTATNIAVRSPVSGIYSLVASTGPTNDVVFNTNGIPEVYIGTNTNIRYDHNANLQMWSPDNGIGMEIINAGSRGGTRYSAGNWTGGQTILAQVGPMSPSQFFWNGPPSQVSRGPQMLNSGYIQFISFVSTVAVIMANESYVNMVFHIDSPAGQFWFDVNGATRGYISPLGCQFQGTTQADNAPEGIVGQVKSCTLAYASRMNTAASGTFDDICSITVSAGDWDFTGIISTELNGATMTGFDGGIGTASGSSATGLAYGDTAGAIQPPTAQDNTLTIPSVRSVSASPVTMYLKGRAWYSAGQPKMYGRMSARRMR